MTRTSVSLATVFSSAQCVLSVVGSVGVILLFAGIPQLIYSPVVSIANLMTFLVGALLITTMVAGNSFLNYKYRSFERQARERRRAQERNGAGSRGTDPEDKPPSYDAIITSDGLPPDYFTIVPEKPPRYEEIVNEIFTVNTTPSQSCITNSPQSCTTATTTPNSTSSVTTITVTTSSASSPVEVTPSASTTTVKGISKSANVVRKPSEERIGEKGDYKQQPNESADAENKHHENANTGESQSQDDTKDRRGDDIERIQITDLTNKVKESTDCVTVTSLSASQNSTHLDESET